MVAATQELFWKKRLKKRMLQNPGKPLKTKKNKDSSQNPGKSLTTKKPIKNNNYKK